MQKILKWSCLGVLLLQISCSNSEGKNRTNSSTSDTPTNLAVTPDEKPIIKPEIVDQKEIKKEDETEEPGWRDFHGQIILDGDIPSVQMIQVNAPCMGPVPSDDLVIDTATKGIKNCIIYLKSNPSRVHPKLLNPAETKVKFDNKNCVFEPHCLAINRQTQVVNAVNSDACAHNVKTTPFNNKNENPILNSNDQKGFDFNFMKSEKVPFPVECNIHSWMKAYWMVLDHPYFAVTDKEGKFSISKLPAEELSFIVWHERTGFLERSLKINLKETELPKLPIYSYPVSRFK